MLSMAPQRGQQAVGKKIYRGKHGAAVNAASVRSCRHIAQRSLSGTKSTAPLFPQAANIARAEELGRFHGLDVQTAPYYEVMLAVLHVMRRIYSGPSTSALVPANPGLLSSFQGLVRAEQRFLLLDAAVVRAARPRVVDLAEPLPYEQERCEEILLSLEDVDVDEDDVVRSHVVTIGTEAIERVTQAQATFEGNWT